MAANIVKEPEYEIDSILSKGQFCTLHKAKRRCILKEFDIRQKDNCSCEEFRIKWLRDVEQLIKIRGHDGVVMYHDVFAQEGKVFIELEYCNGGDLGQFIREKQPGSDVKYRFMTEMSSALAFLHSNNILHQHLHPSNIMVVYKSNKEPIVKLANFGLSKLIAWTKFAGDLIGFYMLGGVAGKYYIAPEVFSHHFGMFTDIYALSLLFSAMILETKFEEKLAVFVTSQNGGILSIGEFASKNKCDFQICPAGFRGVYAVINMMLKFNCRARPSAVEVDIELRKAAPQLYPPPSVPRPFLSPLIKKMPYNMHNNTKKFWNNRVTKPKKM